MTVIRPEEIDAVILAASEADVKLDRGEAASIAAALRRRGWRPPEDAPRQARPAA